MPLRRGFTLVEVLVALAIFTLTAVVLGGAYLNVLNSYEAARRANVNDGDVAFARSQLLTLADLTAAETGADFDDGERHVKWKAEIEPAGTTDLFSVTFTCTTTEGSGASPRDVVEKFMLVRPTWSDPTARSQLRQDAANRIATAQGRQPK